MKDTAPIYVIVIYDAEGRAYISDYSTDKLYAVKVAARLFAETGWRVVVKESQPIGGV